MSSASHDAASPLAPPASVIVVEPGPLDPSAGHYAVPMRDGVVLATDVYLPGTTTEPIPTVLVRLPYDKCGRYTFMPQLAAYVTERGFAAVIQDVRGKFRSQGAQEPFVHEADDGWDTLDWIERQPWSNGHVGMIGDSYYGFTQWAAAASQHRALKAIVPRVTGTWFVGYFSQAEVPRIPLYEWLLGTFVSPLLYYGRLINDPPDHRDDTRIPSWLREAATRHFSDLTEGQRSDILRRRVFPGGNPASQLTIPAMHVGGWWDNLQRYQIADWNAANAAPAREHQYLRLSATDHEDFQLEELGVRGENHELDDTALSRYLPRMLDEPLDFLGYYLRGADEPWPGPRVRFHTVGSGWESALAWPPAEATPMRLYLTDGHMATSSPNGGGLSETTPSPTTAEWLHDPRDPVPFAQDSDWGMLSQHRDEAHTHGRSDVATFTTDAPLADLAGPVVAHLVVSAEAPSTHVIARLHDVYPDGRARFLLGNAAKAATATGPTKVAIRLGDIAYRFRPRHRLRLAVSSSCAGLYLVHPGTGADPWTASELQRTGQQLLCGVSDGSWLDLTVKR